ncbi:hypothetical protein [Mycobacterium sp.]|jgi:hypothetical protein|uniref:hypothetical protein n=1 Tax=Mycobacterium sp. TaxID=1785 RepID=UPI003F9C23C8
MSGAETKAESVVPARGYEPADGWVPADQRWFGLDRRTIAPTLTVFALAFVMSVVLPLVNAAIPYRDLVRAGDVMELQGDVTFVPDAGWGITSGVRAGQGPRSGEYPDRATVVNGDTTFAVRTAPFRGDANALLDQIEKTTDALNRGRGIHVTGQHTTIVTDQGKRGATARITGPQKSGLIAAFVFDGRGVEAEATEGSGDGPEPTAAVIRMIHSISRGGQGKQ